MIDLYKIANRKKSDTLFKRLFEQIPDALFLFSIDSENNYDIELLNESISEMFEITNEDILNDNELIIYERIFIDDRELVLQSLIEIQKKDKRSEFEFRVLLPKKGLCWLKVSSEKELRPNGTLVFFVRISNITDKKKQRAKKY